MPKKLPIAVKERGICLSCNGIEDPPLASAIRTFPYTAPSSNATATAAARLLVWLRRRQ